jgi:hypothetical protein
MAKKPSRGGRVTPKGTQPATTKSTAKPQPAIDHRVVNHFDPAARQRGGAHGAPTRAGHQGGNR